MSSPYPALSPRPGSMAAPPDRRGNPLDIANLFGLPAHPLIVHAVVVLVPLVALGAIAIAVSPSLRARYGTLVAAGAVLDVLLVPLATGSGEQLQPRVQASALLERHTQLGEQLLPFVIALAVATVYLIAAPRLRARRPDGSPWWAAPWIASAMVVVALLGGAGALVQTVRIGHSGAQAAWSGVAKQ